MKSLTLPAAIVMTALGMSAFASETGMRGVQSVSPGRIPANPVPASLFPGAGVSREGLAGEVMDEINRLRTDPRAYVAVLRDYRGQFRDDVVLRPGRISIKTHEGVAAVDEAIRELQTRRALPALRPDIVLARAASDHVADQGPTGGFGHYGADGRAFTGRISRRGGQPYGGENISYGYDTAREVVLQLLVDDNIRDRGHRVNLFREGFVRAGAACGPHVLYSHMCVIDFGYEDRPPTPREAPAP